jgi:hypothetical protein
MHGVAGATAPFGFGSACWHFRDDTQVLHSCCIPHVAFLPDCPIHLCQPQLLACDVFKGIDTDTDGIYLTTFGSHSVLTFNHRQYKCTIPHPPCSGISILNCGPVTYTFQAYFHDVYINLLAFSCLSCPLLSPPLNLLQCP